MEIFIVEDSPAVRERLEAMLSPLGHIAGHAAEADEAIRGILANDSFPVDFLADNLAISLNVIAAAHKAGVRKLLFLGSSCVYPREAPQPMREDALPRPVSPYGVSKLAAEQVSVKGDVIVTGTPGGIGFFRTPKLFMKHGDVCEIEIEGVGTLRNPIVDEKAA